LPQLNLPISVRTPFRPAPHLTSLALALTSAFVSASPGQAQVEDLEALAAMPARSIGPAGMSGRITAIDALDDDPGTVYVGAASGGVWKSTNGGDTFRPLFDDQRIANIGAIAVHPSFRDVVWVGTGEGNPRNSADPGGGIYRSIDGGETWTFLGLEETRQIHRILLHPTDPDVAWVGAMGPIWSAGEERGVYRTTDGGESWDKLLYVDEDTGISEMVQDPVNPNKIIAAMWSFRRWPWYFESGYGDGSGLYITYDGGDSWEELGPEEGIPGGKLGRMGLAISRSNPDWVYALIEAEEGRGLYRSTDGARSFERVNGDSRVLNRPFYYAEIHVDPTNHLRVYNLTSRVSVSDDGGRSFETLPNDIHPDFHAMWIEPTQGELIYLGNDGGLVVSQDGAENFRVTDNLPLGQFYHISVDMDVPFNVYGGMQDNGSWKGPSDRWNVDGIRSWEWVETLFGDGFNSLVDPTFPEQGFGMSQGGNLSRWDVRTGERKPIRPYHPDPEVELRFHWNAALALDPHDPGTIYYGSQFLHRSADQGGTWETLSEDLTTNDPEKQNYDESGGLTRDATGAENHTSILTIAPSPLRDGVIWVGTDDGNVQLTRDDGATWTNFTEEMEGPEPATWVPHIEASKHEAGRAFVVLEDHRRGGWAPWIFMTDDFGGDWKNIGGGIDGFVHTIEEDPVEPNLLFAGSELGLWVSLDRGDSWHKWTHGFPTVPVRSLVVHPRDHDLAIGTFGRAIYILDDIRPLRELARSGEPGVLTAFDPPTAYLQRIAAMNGYHFSGDAVFKGETRMRGAMLSYWIPGDADGNDQGDGEGGEDATAPAEGRGTEAGEDAEGADRQTDITVLDVSGTVVREFQGSADPGLNRTAWDLRADLPGRDDAEAPSGGGGFRGTPRGPEVVPGEYTVRVEYGGDTSETTLRLLPDPRTEVPTADRMAKYEASMEAALLNQRLSRAQDRVGEVEEALDQLLATLDGMEGDDAEALREAARELQDAVDGEVDFEPATSQRRGLYALQSSWDAPTTLELTAMERMAAALTDVETEVNALLAGPVADFRRQVEGTDLVLFPTFDPVGR